MIKTDSPGSQKLRQEIYAGNVFLLPPTTASLALVDSAHDVVVDALGVDYRSAHATLDEIEFFETVGAIRRTIYLDETFHRLVAEVVAEFDVPFSEFAFDPARIRVVAHLGHQNPRAAPVYYGHRDTWYSHPQSLITWWVPLYDLR